MKAGKDVEQWGGVGRGSLSMKEILNDMLATLPAHVLDQKLIEITTLYKSDILTSEYKLIGPITVWKLWVQPYGDVHT